MKKIDWRSHKVSKDKTMKVSKYHRVHEFRLYPVDKNQSVILEYSTTIKDTYFGTFQ
jgi:hypothetical protein